MRHPRTRLLLLAAAVMLAPAAAPAASDDAAGLEPTESEMFEIMAASATGQVEFCKALDPANAAAYDAWFAKSWAEKKSELEALMSKPEFTKKVAERRGSLESQAKDPEHAATLKTSCDTILKAK